MILLTVVLMVAPPGAQSPTSATDHPATPADPRLEGLVERHLRWLGGREAWARVHDLTFTGTIEMHGLSGQPAAATKGCLHFPGAIATDVLLDPSDGRAGWVCEQRDHGATTWTRLSDWRLVDGVRLPFAQTSSGDDGNENARVTWEAIAINTAPAVAEFARPAAKGAGLASIAAGAAATDWVPMTLHLDRYIYLRGTLDGEPTDIVLDSGAGATVVDAALADRLALKTDGQLQARGVGGTQQASFLAGVDIEVGGLTLRGIRAVKLDLSGVGAMLGRGMPVILGKEAFHAVVVDIDYPNSRLAFRTAADFAYAGKGTTVPLVAGGDGHRQVEVTLEGGHQGLCTVDTGSGGTLAVFQAFVDRHDLLSDRTPLSETESGGVGGRIRSKIGTVRSLTFAGYELRSVPATFGADRRGGAFDDDRLLGNLGAGVFSRFRMIFDYSRDALHVEPAADWQTRPFRKDRLGLACQWQGDALVITFVPPGSPAARAGLEVGTRIDQLAGKPVPADRWRETLLAHTQVAAGTEVSLHTADGRDLQLVAADYY